MSSRGTNTASVVGKYAREHHADMNYSESQLLLAKELLLEKLVEKIRPAGMQTLFQDNPTPE